MAPYIASGRVKAIGTTGLKRSPVLPDVPTISESGVPEYEATIWLGLMAPKGVPSQVIERLNAEVGKIVNDQQTTKAWSEQGATGMAMSTSEFGRYLEGDIAKWAKVVQVSGAKPGE
jgi:tripartite-type tricarboxylate transporter receptor subunit TctC